MMMFIDRTLRWLCGIIAAVALFIMMWVTFVDVFGRSFIGRSLPGGLEISEILLVIVIFSVLPLVSWRSEHIVFDSLDAVIPPAAKNIQHRMVHFTCAAAFGYLAYALLHQAQEFAVFGDTTSYLKFPLTPVAFVMAVMLFITAAVHLLFVFAMPRPPAADVSAARNQDRT